MLTSRTVSLKDLTDAALNEEFQFAPNRTAALSRNNSSKGTSFNNNNTTNSSMANLLGQSSFGRAFGGRSALRTSGEMMLSRVSPSNSSFQSLLPLRAQAGTASSLTNMNALLATSGDFHFRPANSSVVGGALLAAGDSFAFAAPSLIQQQQQQQSGAAALLARGSSGHLASAIAAQVTAEGNSSVEGPRFFAGGNGNISAASALLAAHTDKPATTATDDAGGDDYTGDDGDGDGEYGDNTDPELVGAPASKKAAHAAAARRRANGKGATPKRRRVSDVGAGAAAAATPAASATAVADTGKKKLTRAEARTKLRAEQRLAEEALPLIPLFESVSEAQAFHKRMQSETAAKSKQPKIRAVVARPEMRGTFVDLTDFLALPQSDAAKMIGVPTSTLSKRWKEVIDERKWPYRTVGKLDKEIQHLLSSGDASKLDAVRRLLATRQAVLMPVSLRISKLEKLKADVLPPGLDLSQFKVEDNDDDDEDDDDE